MHVDSWTVLDADQQVFTTSITYWGVGAVGGGHAPIYCLAWAVSWLSIEGLRSVIFLPLLCSRSNLLQVCFLSLIYE